MASTNTNTDGEAREDAARERLAEAAEKVAALAREAEAAERIVEAAALAERLARAEAEATEKASAEAVATACEFARREANDRATGAENGHGIATSVAEMAADEVAALAVVGEADAIEDALAEVAAADSWRADARAWMKIAEVARRGGVEVAS